MLGDSKTIDAFKNSTKKMLQNSQLIGVVGSGIKNGMKSAKPLNQDSKRQDIKPLEEMKATDCGALISNITKTQDAKKYERICKNLNEESKKKFDDLSPEDQKAILTIFNINLDDPIDSTPVPPQLAPASPMPSPVPLSPIDEVPLPPPLPAIDEVPLPPPLPVIDEVPLPPPLPVIDDFPQPPLPIATFSMPSPAPLIDLPQSLSFNKKISEAQNYVKNRKNTILNNLIEIFTNDAYSDLKNYYRKNANDDYVDIDILNDYQVCDINNYISKANLSVEDFFKKDSNFKNIMSAISNANLENEEIKNQVKENLYELSNNENLKKKSLSEQDAASIINFLTNENKKIEIMEKMEILNQLKIFDKYNYCYSGYNVKDKLEVFNTLVELIPENESFLDYKDKIINCVNTSAKDGYDAHRFLEDVLKPNIKTIKGKDYKTLLDRMVKCPYQLNGDNLYCDIIFDNDNKYQNISPFILSLIFQNAFTKTEFEDLYNKYLPMLQKADDKTVSNMTGDMLPYLALFCDFLNKIQVNEEADISLESLSFQQLKELQVFLIKNNFNHSFKDININFLNKNLDKIFIKNDNEIDYASTLFEVNKLLSGKHLDLPQIQKDNINNILDVKDDLANIDFEQIKIDKTDKFEVLKSNVNKILEDNHISDNNKAIILARLTNDIDSLMFNELPSGLEDLNVMKPIRDEIKKYLSFKKVEGEKNTYTIGNAKISGMDDKTKSTLESIFKAIPELVVLLGVDQGRGRFDIGKHILAVGKEVVNNKEFSGLDKNNQKLVLIAALMHDIAKVEGGQDPAHPQRGSQYAYKMLSGALNEDEKVTVANLIFNNHFGEYIGKGENNNEKMYTLAYECKDENPEFLKMLKILGEADLLGDAESYKKMTKDYLEQIPGRIDTLTQKVETINDILAKLKKTLDLTPFPQKTEDRQTAMQECKELGIVGEFKSGDIKIDKVDLAKMKNLSSEKQEEYLSLLGFHNTQYNQLEFLIHAIGNGKQVGGIDYLTSQFKSDATLSTSIITMANTETFNWRQYGFIMEPDKTKVLSAATSNIGSGCGKGRDESGKYISQSNKMNYTNLLEYIKNSRMEAQGGHSELITIDNEVAAIFVKEGCEDKMPKELVEFAHERKLPLIVVPKSKFEDAEEM